MFKRRKFLLLLALVLILGLSVKIEVWGDFKNDEAYKSIRLIVEALTLIQNNYLEIDKINTQDLIHGAIEGAIGKLGDPHTRFMNPELYKEMKVETQGSFGGLGVVVTIRDEKLLVISPIEGTPAHKIGVKAADHIIEIDNEPTKNLTLFEVVRRLRGRPGTKVRITVEREGEEAPLKFEITRAVIEIESVKHGVIKEGIGYIRIVNFSQDTPQELKKALNDLDKRDIKSLILDLRNNPGGLLEVAVPVADCFIREGSIVSIKGRDQKEEVFKAKQEGTFRDVPLVLLINGASASASEIVAGAIQDTKRGVILGTKSFGKGSVQTVLPLKDGSGMAITTAKYYTPSGLCIHEVGITPDIIVEDVKLSKAEIKMLKRLNEKGLIEKFLKSHPGDYTEKDFEGFLEEIKTEGIELNKSIIKRRLDEETWKIKGEQAPLYHLETDIQLQRAIDLLVAREIFHKGL